MLNLTVFVTMCNKISNKRINRTSQHVQLNLKKSYHHRIFKQPQIVLITFEHQHDKFAQIAQIQNTDSVSILNISIKNKSVTPMFHLENWFPWDNVLTPSIPWLVSFTPFPKTVFDRRCLNGRNVRNIRTCKQSKKSVYTQQRRPGLFYILILIFFRVMVLN